MACLPKEGDVVRLRTRSYLVEGVIPSSAGHRVRCACLDDDAQGDILEVIWEIELDAEVLQGQGWQAVGQRGTQGDRGFDVPRHFGAYLHTLRWNTITATDPNLFQSPFRAGIRIEPFQLEPLNKALRLPRVNLFIADDVGLGKTIEAGLIASELLLRRRIREIVVACPPSMKNAAPVSPTAATGSAGSTTWTATSTASPPASANSTPPASTALIRSALPI